MIIITIRIREITDTSWARITLADAQKQKLFTKYASFSHFPFLSAILKSVINHEPTQHLDYHVE